MKIKVIMTDKAMDRETMDQREKMLSAAVSEGVVISVDCIKKGRMSWTATRTRHLPPRSL